MTFKEANNLPLHEIVSAFEIIEKDDICFDCVRYKKCRARLVFRMDYPNSVIDKCHMFALWESDND